MTQTNEIVAWFEQSRLSRRQVMAQLAALGVAAAGFPLRTRAAEPANSSATFRAVDLNHIAINVSDVGRSHAWYMKHLGLKPMGEAGFLTTGKGWLTLFRGEKPGLHHYCYSIDNYIPDKVVAKLKTAGLTPSRVQGGRVYFDDPDGIECQLANTILGDRLIRPDARNPADSTPTFQAVDLNHVALNVSDVQRSREWYEKHLGLQVIHDEGEQSCALTTGKGWVALFKSERPGLGHYCFSVDKFDPDEAVAKLKAAGLTPKRREDRVSFNDPDGIECGIANANKTVADK